MEENKYICPKCGSEMIAIYEKPALNLTCPNCGCKITTTKWDDIDLDDTDFEIIIEPVSNPSIKQIKFISNFSGLNFINSKKILSEGGSLLIDKAVEIKEKISLLKKADIRFIISPDFPY